MRDANRYLGLELPEDGSDTTVAGFMLAQVGRLLRSGNVVEYDGDRFKIGHADQRCIQRIRYIPAEQGCD